MDFNKTFHYNGPNYYTNSPIELPLDIGSYLIECWGGAGALGYSKGAYAAGVITIKIPRSFYLYIGSMGILYSAKNAYNGGGQGQTGGGGATDVRLTPGDWGNFDSLKSRIIVAGGGAGFDNGDIGGSGGCLVGLPSQNNYGKGGSQTSGGIGYVDGKFGSGGGCNVTNDAGNGGGGGGYYGGGSSTDKINYGGGGGSSFISGHKGCNAISNSSTEDYIIPTNQSIHYSNISFFNSKMIDGDHEMPSAYGGLQVGNPTSGSIRITPVSIIIHNTCHKSNHKLHFSLFL